MCTFINYLPTNSTSIESKKTNLQIFLSSTPKGEYYRVRLLAFKNPLKNNRDFPFIERYVHNHWNVSEDGRRRIDSTVICPVTSFVKTVGSAYDACPICKYSNLNFLSFKESGWTDRESSKKSNQYQRKFEAIIPVYVINDPKYPQNNSKFKVIIFNDKNFYTDLKSLIQKESLQTNVFNGTKAVDFYFHLTDETKIVGEGTPNQHEYTTKVIDKYGFTKIEKAYEIPAITKEAIDTFEFDDNYYVSSSPEELTDFYNSYIKISNDDIPDEDMGVFEEKKQAPKTSKPKENPRPNPTPTPVPVVDNSDIMDMIDDDEKPTPPKKEVKVESVKKESTQTKTEMIDDIEETDDIDIDEIGEGSAKSKKTSDLSDDIDIDDLLSDLE